LQSFEIYKYWFFEFMIYFKFHSSILQVNCAIWMLKLCLFTIWML
jgi:hypothetical protein